MDQEGEGGAAGGGHNKKEQSYGYSCDCESFLREKENKRHNRYVFQIYSVLDKVS